MKTDARFVLPLSLLLPACFSPEIPTLDDGLGGSSETGEASGDAPGAESGSSSGAESGSESSDGSGGGQPLSCGDGYRDPSEVCDDGVNDGSYGGCMPGCDALGPYCGDGVVDGGETCDDGDNDGAYDGCMPGCQALAPYCGDGMVSDGESCDDGNGTIDDTCNPSCTLPGEILWVTPWTAFGLDTVPGTYAELTAGIVIVPDSGVLIALSELGGGTNVTTHTVRFDPVDGTVLGVKGGEAGTTYLGAARGGDGMLIAGLSTEGATVFFTSKAGSVTDSVADATVGAWDHVAARAGLGGYAVLRETSDGGSILRGYVGTDNTFEVTDADDHLRGVAVTGAGVFSAGRVNSTGRLIVYNHAVDGNLVDSTLWEPPGVTGTMDLTVRGVVGTSDDGVLVFGSAQGQEFVSKYDTSLDLVWTLGEDVLPVGMAFEDACETPTGDIVLVGQTYSANTETAVWKTSPSGDTRWFRALQGFRNSDSGPSIACGEDDGMFVATNQAADKVAAVLRIAP